ATDHGPRTKMNLLPSEEVKADEGRAQPVRGARMALFLLLSINLFNYIDRQVLAAVEPDIRRELLPNDPNAMMKTGWLSTAFLLTYMLVSPIFGYYGDRVSRWLLIGIGVILWSLASGASGIDWPVPLAHAYTVLLITRFFVGIGESAYGPTAPTLISDMYPVKRRGQVLAGFYVAIPVGSALGYTLGGLCSGSLGWRWAFYLVVPPGILLGLWCLWMPEPPRGHSDQVSSRDVHWRDYLVLAKCPSYVLDCLGMTAMTFAMGALGFWMPAYLEYRKAEAVAGIDPVTFFGGLTALCGLIATILGGLAGDWLQPRFSGSYFLVSGFGLAVGFPMVLLVTMTPFPLAWVFIALAVFFLFFNTGPANTILANVTHPSIRAGAFAINIFFIHALGDAISPPLIGLVADERGLDAGFRTISYTILVGAFFWLWGARYLQRDADAATTQL
ncbi:MAG: spinster family MFS transporter, partial [Gemmataceae bacterium]